LRFCASRASAGVTPAAERRRRPFSRHSNDVTAGTGAPFDPAPRVVLERDVAPTASGLHLFEDIDACHRVPPLAERTLLSTLRENQVNNNFVFISMWQPDL
jgi:hypothetical protein